MKEAKRTRDIQLRVRLNEKESAELNRKAEMAKLPKSTVIRMLLTTELLHFVRPRGVAIPSAVNNRAIEPEDNPCNTCLYILRITIASLSLTTSSPFSPLSYPRKQEYGRANFPSWNNFRFPHATFSGIERLSSCAVFARLIVSFLHF